MCVKWCSSAPSKSSLSRVRMCNGRVESGDGHRILPSVFATGPHAWQSRWCTFPVSEATALLCAGQEEVRVCSWETLQHSTVSSSFAGGGGGEEKERRSLIALRVQCSLLCPASREGQRWVKNHFHKERANIFKLYISHWLWGKIHTNKNYFKKLRGELIWKFSLKDEL